jgi:hypothetical protein
MQKSRNQDRLFEEQSDHSLDLGQGLNPLTMSWRGPNQRTPSTKPTRIAAKSTTKYAISASNFAVEHWL